MDYEQVKGWLDALIDIELRRKEIQELSTEIRTRNECNTISIERGIEILADVMGKQMHYQSWGGEEKHCYYFQYRGYNMMQVCKTELEGVQCVSP